MASVGVPIKLLLEGEGHAVTVEMKNGELYRGHLDQVRSRGAAPVLVACMCTRTHALAVRACHGRCRCPVLVRTARTQCSGRPRARQSAGSGRGLLLPSRLPSRAPCAS